MAESYSPATPKAVDTQRILLGKILQSINSGGGGGGAGSSGTGSPEGVVTSSPGGTYLDVATGNFWAKQTGTGNTGWLLLLSS